jgi:hypothetical protein
LGQRKRANSRERERANSFFERAQILEREQTLFQANVMCEEFLYSIPLAKKKKGPPHP